MQIVAQDKQAADMGLEYAKNAAFFLRTAPIGFRLVTTL